MKLSSYAYVSLFGVNSLDDLKYALFANRLAKENITDPLSTESLRAAANTAKQFAAKNSWIANIFPVSRGLLSSIAPALFMSVRQMIICLDDLERKGPGLDLGDILGLVSFLREERKCKVVLLLNNEALGNDKSTFEKYLEKVVDVTLAYNVTPDESLKKADLKPDDIGTQVSACCVALGIINVRVIKKIDALVRSAKPLFEQYDQAVFVAATKSLALFCWAYHQPDDAPSFAFFRSKKSERAFGTGAGNFTTQEIAWNALLSSYDFGWVDELDLVLMKGVENGYLDPDELAGPAAKADERAKATKADGSFEDAWRLYHDSFDENEEEALNAIAASFEKNVKYISPINLNGTVRLFKELDRSEQARSMIGYYVDNRQEPRQFFDLEQYPFSGDISDPDVISAFKAKLDSFPSAPATSDMLAALKGGSWDTDTIDNLASLSTDEYYKIIANAKGEELRRIVSGCLQFDRIGNATEPMKEISKKARDALLRIALTSKINARRVAGYGIKVPSNFDTNTREPGG